MTTTPDHTHRRHTCVVKNGGQEVMKRYGAKHKKIWRETQKDPAGKTEDMAGKTEDTVPPARLLFPPLFSHHAAHPPPIHHSPTPTMTMRYYYEMHRHSSLYGRNTTILTVRSFSLQAPMNSMGDDKLLWYLGSCR